ncbi:MAG: tetratricopeptide repeat protein, partial [Candidatus Microthrix parvicella]
VPLFEVVERFAHKFLGVDHPDTLTARANLASSYRQAGRTNDAITLLQEVVDRQDGVIGPDHPDAVARREALVGWRREADER